MYEKASGKALALRDSNTRKPIGLIRGEPLSRVMAMSTSGRYLVTATAVDHLLGSMGGL